MTNRRGTLTAVRRPGGVSNRRRVSPDTFRLIDAASKAATAAGAGTCARPPMTGRHASARDIPARNLRANMSGAPLEDRQDRTSLYTRLNQILDEQGFDRYVEGLCTRFYADEGWPGLPPARCFRLLLIGFFEGLDAERAIAWR